MNRVYETIVTLSFPLPLRRTLTTSLRRSFPSIVHLTPFHAVVVSCLYKLRCDRLRLRFSVEITPRVLYSRDKKNKMLLLELTSIHWHSSASFERVCLRHSRGKAILFLKVELLETKCKQLETRKASKGKTPLCIARLFRPLIQPNVTRVESRDSTL